MNLRLCAVICVHLRLYISEIRGETVRNGHGKVAVESVAQHEMSANSQVNMSHREDASLHGWESVSYCMLSGQASNAALRTS